jgi:hypothetical protein
MIKGFTFDGVPGSLIREIWNDKRVKTTPSKVNPFIILDLSYKTAPPKVNPFIIPDFSYKTTRYSIKGKPFYHSRSLLSYKRNLE